MSLEYSVALCTFNGSNYIAEQLISILRQTHLPSQVVISDDCSEDKTLEIVAEIIMEHSESRPEISKVQFDVFKQEERIGVSENFTFALKACYCQHIFLSDQDDIWVESKAEETLGLFETNPDLSLVFTDTELINYAGELIGSSGFDVLDVTNFEKRKIAKGNASFVLLKRNIVTGATVCINRDLLGWAFPIPNKWVHDEWLALVASLVGEVQLLDNKLTRYRQHNHNEIGLKKKTIKNKLGRMLHPGKIRNQILLTRAVSFSEHTVSELIESAKVASTGKLAHELVRSKFRVNRVLRLPAVVGELLSGRYFKYGLGVKDFLRDLIQPNG